MGLQARLPHPVRLGAGGFWFYGDGPFTNYGPFPDWLYWQEYLFDLRGTQETESRTYAEALSRLIGAPVEPPGS